MKSLYLLFPLLLLLTAASAQQEGQFTQFMYNKMMFNPAAAGLGKQPVLSATMRSQWMGLEGAPETQLLSFETVLGANSNVGIGANLFRQTIGISENFEFNTIYSYQIEMGIGYLRGGLQASVRLMRSDFSQVESIQPAESDPAIPLGIESKYVPNFGAGIYYTDLKERVYVGFSVPRLLENNIDLSDEQGVISRELRHLYVMGGIKLPLGEGIEKAYVQPQVLLKYVEGAPFDADVNVNVFFAERFLAGLSYRIGGSKSSSLGESVSLLLGMDLTEKLTFGLSYDATLSELNSYNNGSIEGLLRYRFSGKPQGDPEKAADKGRFF